MVDVVIAFKLNERTRSGCFGKYMFLLIWSCVVTDIDRLYISCTTIYDAAREKDMKDCVKETAANTEKALIAQLLAQSQTILAEMRATMAAMDARMDADTERLEGRMESIEGRMERMGGRMERMEGRMTGWR